MPFLDTRHKKKSFTLTTALLSALLLLMFYIGLTYLEPPIENGITVNFGTTNFGSGEVQPRERVQSQPAEQQEKIEEVAQEEEAAPPEEVEPEEVAEKPAEKLLTREEEEAIKIKQQQETERKEAAARKAKAEQLAREQKAAEERARQEQEAKKKQLDELMGGLNKSEGTAQGSEGDDQRAGDKGQPDGDPYATSYYGTPGRGSGTGGYGLNGRSLVNKGKVQQECNQEGRVVVQIVVDRNGKVISANPGVRGTTNNDPCLLEPARKTAFMHQWNTDTNAPSQQTGFVVVNFKLGE